MHRFLRATGRILLVTFIVAQSFLSYGIVQSIYVLNYKLKNIVKVKHQIILLEDSVKSKNKELVADITKLLKDITLVESKNVTRFNSLQIELKSSISKVESENITRLYSLWEDVKKLETNSKEQYEYGKSVSVWVSLATVWIRSDHATPILVPLSMGSGIVVKKTENYSYVVTCYHVIDSADYGKAVVRIKTKNGDYVEAYVLDTDEENDLALLLVEDPLTKYATLKSIADIGIADKVFTVGNGLGFEDTYAEGLAVGYSDTGDILFTLATTPGDSGSGVFDSKGNLVAILSSVYVPRGSYDFTTGVGVHTKHIRKLLNGII